MRGIFITLEGMDGCGKSTQIEMLAQALESRRLDFIITREPGGTPVGESVRSLLISDRYTDSTVAFQGHGRGLDLSIIDRVNELATGGFRPDLTILFDLDPEIA